jgi:hypothetical protein
MAPRIQPRAWELSLMQPVYKGGNKLKTDPASCRGIYLSSALAKTFEGILLHRLTQYDTGPVASSQCLVSPRFRISASRPRCNVNIGAVRELNRGLTVAYPVDHHPLGCCLKSWPSSLRCARVCPPCDLLDTLNPRQLLGRMHLCFHARKTRF